MIIDRSTPEVLKALRAVDINFQPVIGISRFDTAAKLAMAYRGKTELVEVEISRFCFIGGEDLKKVLPKSLQDHVVTIF